MTAVSPKTHIFMPLRTHPKESVPLTDTIRAFPESAAANASTLPSPPSATGKEVISAEGRTSFIAALTVRQTSEEVIVPLKESGAISIFISRYLLSRPPERSADEVLLNYHTGLLLLFCSVKFCPCFRRRYPATREASPFGHVSHQNIKAKRFFIYFIRPDTKIKPPSALRFSEAEKRNGVPLAAAPLGKSGIRVRRNGRNTVKCQNKYRMRPNAC